MERNKSMMGTNRKRHRSSLASGIPLTVIRRHNKNISSFLRQLSKDEKTRMVQIETDWTAERALTLLGQLDVRQLDFIEFIDGMRSVPAILEYMGFKRYDQLVSFLSSLDAKLLQAGAHPSEV